MEPDRELGPGDLVEQQIEQLAVLAVAQADEVAGEDRIHEQRAFTGRRMNADDGMHRGGRRLVLVVAGRASPL